MTRSTDDIDFGAAVADLKRPEIYGRVLKALPLAHHLIARAGIDPAANDAEGYGVAMTILQLANLPDALPELFEDQQIAHVERYGEAGYVLGVAVGLLLNPASIFTKGQPR